MREGRYPPQAENPAVPTAPRSRDPDRLPQDLYIWGSAAVEMVLSVPDRDLPLLRSPVPGVRAVLAADPRCSSASRRILACDVDEVRLALADAPGTDRDVLDVLLVGEYVAQVCDADRSFSDVAASLWVRPELGHVAPRVLMPPDRREMQMAYLAGRNCRPELLRLFWRDGRLKWLSAVQPNIPDDLLLLALAHRKKKVREGAQRQLRRRGREWEISWQEVRAVAVRLPAHRRRELLADLPSRFVYRACSDPDAGIRLAAADCVGRADVLRQLAADPSPLVRRAAGKWLLDLIAG